RARGPGRRAARRSPNAALRDGHLALGGGGQGPRRGLPGRPPGHDDGGSVPSDRRRGPDRERGGRDHPRALTSPKGARGTKPNDRAGALVGFVSSRLASPDGLPTRTRFRGRSLHQLGPYAMEGLVPFAGAWPSRVVACPTRARCSTWNIFG